MIDWRSGRGGVHGGDRAQTARATQRVVEQQLEREEWEGGCGGRGAMPRG